MTEPVRNSTHAEAQLLARGRSEGLAAAAVSLGALSFFQLLGTEKAILAILLALLALRGSPSVQGRRRSFAAIMLGAIYLVIAAVTLVLYRDRLGELIRLVQSLG